MALPILRIELANWNKKVNIGMARAGIDKKQIVEKAALLANEMGLENVTLKVIADAFGIQTPSLYNHIKSLDDLKKGLMLYGIKGLEGVNMEKIEDIATFCRN